MADAAAPYTAGLIEHLAPITFTTRRFMALVANVPDAPGAVAISQEIDCLGLMT